MDQATTHRKGGSAQRLHKQAVEALTRGDLSGGRKLLEQALAQDPDSADILADLGTACWQSGQPADAESAYARAVRLAPQNPIALNGYGTFLLEQGRLDEAGQLLASAHAAAPGDLQIANNLGLLHYRKGRLAEAEKLFVQALRQNTNWPPAHVNLGNVLLETGRFELAAKAFQYALKLDPRNAPGWLGLGKACAKDHKDEEAIKCFHSALSIDANMGDAWFNLLATLEWLNRTDEATRAAEQAAKLFPGEPRITYYHAKLLGRANEVKKAIDLLEDSVQKATRAHAPIYDGVFFELGKLYDRQENIDAAFANFTRAQEARTMQDGGAGYSASAIRDEIALIRKNFTAEYAASAPQESVAPPAAPVFIVGFPRSGTTLLDQILSSHPGIQVAEERPAINRICQYLAQTRARPASWPPPGRDTPFSTSCLLPAAAEELPRLQKLFFGEHAKYMSLDRQKILVDKLPLNIMSVGVIKRVLPQARFILALRHPCDAVLSCFMQRFQMNSGMAHMRSIADAAAFYDDVFGLWDHYNKVLDLDVHQIRYEDVVAGFRPTVEKTLGFLGLPWNDAVLAFDETAKNKARINTPSYHQVTQKLYTRASGRWLRYRQHLEPVLDILRPHAEKFGYAME